jgi:predicted Zn-dependent peptidase
MKAAGWMLAVALVAAAATAQERPNRTEPPALGPQPRLTLPVVQERKLDNGLRVMLLEAHDVPLVQVSLLIQAGSADDPAGSFGLASFTAAMLDEGAGTRSALEIADDVEFLGAELGTSSSFDASAVRLNVPARSLEQALPIMADVALRPTFPAAELERLRQERLTALIQTRDDPAGVAPPAFARVLYGAAHRFGTSTIGTTATLEAVTAEQLRAFHAARYRPDNATLIVVGDVTPAAAMPLLERAFGGWRAAASAARAQLTAAPRPAARAITIVDMPGAEQSQIRIGTVGVARSTPDYFALQVLNTVLGGSFTSRLNQNLREEHGYAYGARSQFDMRRAPGPFTAAAGVQTDKTAESLTEFFKELEAIRAPIGAEELGKAKNYLALGLPGDFETLGDLAARVEELVVFGLPNDYYADYTARIAAVTSADVQRAAAAHIDPDKLAVVVVGDRRRIEAPIRALNLGPVRVVGVDEVVP